MMTPTSYPPDSLSPIQLREIALAAMVDVRTLVRTLSGRRVRHLTRERIARILEARGLRDLLPKATRP